ncbi:nuclear exosome regulator NRDE2 isoform X2 [Sitodiplosis mosellana]|uniref:nuclear exosome regulator NRDE2 isoform X2 n=1 Tax=Sitodiplosis mosellana TaxID=263140 RepID=UPI002443DAD7|nr:nuclear exosome regulator NRDE2 isoform X2 [Sitodiplosis mosellana]
MSLFPAYSNIASTSQNDETPATSTQTEKNEDWLTNSSFQVAANVQRTEADVEFIDSDDDEPTTTTQLTKQKKHSKKKKKKDHKHHKDKRPKLETVNKTEPKSEFTGKENYYVDKKPCNSYYSMETLKRDDSARYRVTFHYVGTLTSQQWRILHRRRSKDKLKRYFTKHKTDKVKTSAPDGDGGGCGGGDDDKETTSKNHRLNEEDFTAKTKVLNKNLLSSPKDIDLWLEYVRFQDHFYMKMTKIQMAERKMEILNKALRDNPSNERLYREYIDILEQAYPSFEVSKFLDALIQKDPANYILWNAQIMATQGSMARCRVPDVMTLYEKCMKNMYKRNRCDDLTLRLFNSCALFLRQSGLSEQFFALLTLALELNVSENKFSKIQSKESDQNSLIEYEEIVLKSGLPMNEIWLRVEKLRQNYYFLPCPMDRSCSDPQRVVLNEDIYHYIYPLSNRDFAFNLVIIVLRLLKIPLFDNCRLKSSIFNTYDVSNCDNLCDFDCIEEITPIFLHRTILHTNKVFDDILWGMIRDFSIGPSFVTTHIGHELYIKYLGEVLLLCAECFTNRADQSYKRNIFVLLLLRLERIVMAFDVYMNKWNEDKTKRLRTKIKNLLKRDENRNCLVFYVEFAQIEYDLKRFEQAEHIYIAAISQSNPTIDDDCTRSEYWYVCISLIEMLIREQQLNKALNLLNAIALDKKIDPKDYEASEISEASNLLASKKLDERLKNICFIERNVSIMDIVQSFQPDYLMCVIKANVYHKILWRKSKDDAVKQLDVLLKSFPEKNHRHEFIREQLYEIYANLMLYKLSRSLSTVTLTAENETFLMVSRGLDEFPTNMHLLKCAAMCHNQPWHRIRALLVKHHSPIAIMFLVVAAQFRYKKYANTQSNTNPSLSVDLDYLNVLSADVKDIENAYKTRVTNLLKMFTDHEAATRKNSLLWRLYLRSLLDVSNDFDKCRNILLTALNECPWNKALYLDGTVYVPQELAHLQDLIIEKQLRIYAMPEELEILRNFDEVK